jgi:NADPH:quinone reductase-like Zn-dependent oxidoreductase
VELIAVPQDMFIGRAPQGVDLATAGAAPLAGIAAIMAIDSLELSDGDTVLIVGATGGVGSLAVQLAASAGATVVAPALPEDETHLRELGLSEVLPRDGDLAAAARERHPEGFDAVLDRSTTRRTSPRLSPRKAAVSPRPPEPPAKAPDGR